MKEGKKSIFKKWWFWVIVVVVFIAIVGSGGNDDKKEDDTTANNTVEQGDTNKETSQEATEKPTKEPTEKPTAEPTPEPIDYTLGTVLEFKDLQIFFKSSEVAEIDNQFADVKEAVLIEVEIKNNSNKTDSLGWTDTCFSPDGLESSSQGAYFDSAIEWLGNIRSGAVQNGHLVYEYKEDGEYILEFAGFWDKPIEVKIPVEKDNKIESDVSSQFVAELISVIPNNSIGIGDMIEFDDLEILFKSLSVKKIDNQFAENENAIVIEVDITNKKDETHSLNMFNYSCYDANGLTVGSAGAYFDDAIEWMGEMRTDSTMSGSLPFDYTGDGIYVIEFGDIFGSNTIEVYFDVKKE